MKKNGFIATSLIYSFFLIFVTLFLTIIADYLQNKVLLNTIESSIKNDINDSLGIQDFKVGDILFFTNDILQCIGNTNSVNLENCGFDSTAKYYIKDIEYKVEDETEISGKDLLYIGKYKNNGEIDETYTDKIIYFNNIRLKKQADTNTDINNEGITIAEVLKYEK